MTIRIEPDWNVKAGIYETQGESWAIRIEPDWNVKVGKGSRKGHYKNIRIEPDWNVKVMTAAFAAFSAALE